MKFNFLKNTLEKITPTKKPEGFADGMQYDPETPFYDAEAHREFLLRNTSLPVDETSPAYQIEKDIALNGTPEDVHNGINEHISTYEAVHKKWSREQYLQEKSLETEKPLTQVALFLEKEASGEMATITSNFNALIKEGVERKVFDEEKGPISFNENNIQNFNNLSLGEGGKDRFIIEDRGFSKRCFGHLPSMNLFTEILQGYILLSREDGESTHEGDGIVLEDSYYNTEERSFYSVYKLFPLKKTTKTGRWSQHWFSGGWTNSSQDYPDLELSLDAPLLAIYEKKIPHKETAQYLESLKSSGHDATNLLFT